jgi:GT2 family glycosyltransferase
MTLPNISRWARCHAGMKWGDEQGYDWLWLMDDDGRPAKDCLEKLMEHARPNRVMVPVQQDSAGRLYGISRWHHQYFDVTAEVVEQKQEAVSGKFIFTFVGPLISGKIIEQVGLPNKDFFIWFDDLEYSVRILSKTEAQVIAVPGARFFHDFYGAPKEVSFLGRRSMRNSQAAWKTYYGTRNHLYIVLNNRRNPREILSYFSTQMRYLVGELMYEPDRWHRLKVRLMGVRDGALGRLGKRVTPG